MEKLKKSGEAILWFLSPLGMAASGNTVPCKLMYMRLNRISLLLEQ